MLKQCCGLNMTGVTVRTFIEKHDVPPITIDYTESAPHPAFKKVGRTSAPSLILRFAQDMAQGKSASHLAGYVGYPTFFSAIIR